MHRFIDDHPVRPNLRRHPLDRFEEAMVEDDPPSHWIWPAIWLAAVSLSMGLTGAAMVWLALWILA